jgi:chromosomal replication initiation ATPase DnaA
MHYTIPQQISTARSITRAAEQQIKSKTGMRVNLMLCADSHLNRTPEQLIAIVIEALGMTATDLSRKSRKRDVVELRFIVATLLRTYFPSLTLLQISVHFGGQDHTSVLNGLARAQCLLQVKDPSFTTKYQTALQYVNQWLKREVSGLTSPISA